MDKELKKYISQMREHGYSDIEIQKELKKAGWNDAHFEHHFETKATEETPAIEVKNLKKYFGETKAVGGVSFSIKKGEIFGFLGPNGAGKTTTIRSMMDFYRPDSGSISILGFDSVADSVRVKEKIGYLSGNIHLYDKWTGGEHIKMLRSLHDNKEDIADDLAARLGFNSEVPTKKLSSGNRQKLGIIMAFMFSPEILILDEPTNALDPLLQNIVYELLKEAKDKGSTVFMSSHNMAEVERVCDRVGIIRNGKMAAIETIETLKSKQIYTLRVKFSAPFDRYIFKEMGVEVVEEWNETGVTLKAKGDINNLLQKISNHNIQDVTINHASLEEVFLEFYKN